MQVFCNTKVVVPRMYQDYCDNHLDKYECTLTNRIVKLIIKLDKVNVGV